MRAIEEKKAKFFGSDRQQIKEMVYKEQILKRKGNEKNRILIKRSGEIKVMHTAIDGLMNVIIVKVRGQQTSTTTSVYAIPL